MALLGDFFDFLSGGKTTEAEEAQKKAVDLALNAKHLQLGKYKPQAEGTINQGDSAYNNISLDPTTRRAQMQALSQLQDVSTHGGLTDGDKAALADIAATQDASARGHREAVLDNARARGVGGSGLEMLGELMADQNAASNAAAQGRGTAQSAQARALQATMAAADVGGAVRNQDYGMEAQKAAARDKIANYNAQNAQGVMGRNVGNTNYADYTNNITVPNQQFQGDLALTGLQSGALGGQAAAYNQAADRNTKFVGDTIEAVGNVIGSAAKAGATGGALTKMPSGTAAPPPSELLPVDPAQRFQQNKVRR